MTPDQLAQEHLTGASFGCIMDSYTQDTPMTSAKDTYELCESLIQNKIDDIFVSISHWSRECADHNEEFIYLKRRKSEELRKLYKHLDNIQQLKAQ